MGVIRNVSSGAITLLHAHHLFGRDPLAADTTIPAADVSKSHATIKWQGGGWVLHDHSLNGTLYDEKYIHQSMVNLSLGTVIQFGESELTRWELLDTEQPMSFLRCLDSTEFFLPEDPSNSWGTALSDVSFFLDRRQYWHMETDTATYKLQHGTVVIVKGRRWQYVQNEVIEETLDNGQLIKSAYFQFDLSHDEEHVILSVFINGHHYNIGERTYNQLLLALARIRLKDWENGLAFEQQGWISTEQIIEMLSREIMRKVDQYYLNLQIHRLRKQLMSLKPYGYLLSGAIERQRGEIRFAHPAFEILKNGKVLRKVEG